jgi:hypothetical protein
VTIINTDGMAFIGPGSEWFWTALSGIVLAVTFLAIYRQLSLARGANAFTQLNALVDEWQGERLVRKRVAVLAAIRDGIAPAELQDSPAGAIANYWEKVASLVRAGHVTASLIAEGLGSADSWWGILAPWVAKARMEDGNPQLFEHFEWLAATLVRLHPVMAFDQAAFERTLGGRLVAAQAELRDLEAMRAPVAPRDAPSGPRRGRAHAEAPLTLPSERT